MLLDDDFATIVAAIAEGRQLFQNLKVSFRYLLMIHVPLVVTAALVPLAGHPLLYLPIHLVWLELVIHPAALFAFQGPPGAAELAAIGSGLRTRSAHLVVAGTAEAALALLVTRSVELAPSRTL